MKSTIIINGSDRSFKEILDEAFSEIENMRAIIYVAHGHPGVLKFDQNLLEAFPVFQESLMKITDKEEG